jgi:RimJ/RimL family protein N-acetyltransferase
MTILTSARLRFEPFDDRHLDGLQAINGDPEVMRWLGGRPDTRDDTRATIARVRTRWAEFGFGWWALLDRASGEVVGAAGLKHLEHDRANPHEIGWRLHRDHWGRGLADEAARTILQHAFGTVGAPQVLAIRHPGNAASERLMRKLGMVPLGLQTWDGAEVAVHRLDRAAWAADPAMRIA